MRSIRGMLSDWLRDLEESENMSFQLNYHCKKVYYKKDFYWVVYEIILIKGKKTFE